MIATTVSSGAKLPGGGEFLEHRDRRAAGGLGQQALGGGEQVDAGEDLGVAGEAAGAAAFAHGVDHQVAVAGRADRERVRGGLGRDRVDLGLLGEDRAGDRVAAARLGDVDARRVGLGQPEQLQLAQALVQARGERAAGGRR